MYIENRAESWKIVNKMSHMTGVTDINNTEPQYMPWVVYLIGFVISQLAGDSFVIKHEGRLSKQQPISLHDEHLEI